MFKTQIRIVNVRFREVAAADSWSLRITIQTNFTISTLPRIVTANLSLDPLPENSPTSNKDQRKGVFNFSQKDIFFGNLTLKKPLVQTEYSIFCSATE